MIKDFNHPLYNALELHYPEIPFELTPVHGGDSTESYLINFDDQSKKFVKYSSKSDAFAAFDAESYGLNLLRETIYYAPKAETILPTEQGAALVMEYIPPGNKSKQDWEAGGILVAKLHQQYGKIYGFQRDNYIGRLAQLNETEKDWPTFFISKRLEPQIKLALDVGRLSGQSSPTFKHLYKTVELLLPNPQPALLHGDLWSGNLHFDRNSQPWLIDPCPYYGDPTMDLAMTRLFGGFSERFYQSYYSCLPPALRDPDSKIMITYQLYYLLVHLNMFGSSYAHAVMNHIHQIIK